MAWPCRTESMPRMVRLPLVGGETQPIIRIVDDLPAPLGPRKPNASPRCSSNSIPSTAVKSPNRFVRSVACMRTSESGTRRQYPGLPTISNGYSPTGAFEADQGTPGA